VLYKVRVGRPVKFGAAGVSLNLGAEFIVLAAGQ
jgi:hypothetical protein